MADTSLPRGRWASRPGSRDHRSIVELIQAGTVDAELAATVWLLLDGRVPLVVAADDVTLERRTAVLEAFLDFTPDELRLVELAGAGETFDWLPQASELGWSSADRVGAAGAEWQGEERQRGRGSPSTGTGPPVRPDDTVLVALDLSADTPQSTWGEAARLAVRAASIGYGLAATTAAGSLDEVFAGLRSAPVRLTDDELSRLGVVLVLRGIADERVRVAAAHYVRPVVRDVHGHLQRLGPAVLATWDEGTDTVEQFGWGIAPELASRVGLRAGDFELEVAARRLVLEALVHDGVTEPHDVRLALRRHSTASALRATLPDPSPTHALH